MVVVSHNSNNSTLPNSRIMSFEFFAESIVDVILLQIGLKCCSIRMIFDPLHKPLNSEMFCFLYNWVWQSWYSEINFEFLFLIHRDGSPRTCLIIFNMFRCQNTTFCGFVSGYAGLSVLVGSVTLSCFSWLRVSQSNLVRSRVSSLHFVTSLHRTC